MKKYIFSAIALLCLLGSGVALTSCSDVDPVQDVDLPRVLMPYDLTAVPDQMEPAITVSWEGTKNAQYYVVEAYLDDPDFEGTPVITKEVYGTECVLEDLLGETMYNIRVKGVAEGKEDSKWATINRATAPEQILSVPYNDIEETSITITWPTRKEVNAYKVLQNGSVVASGAISSAEAAAGEKVITGLTGGTTYTFEVYLNDKRRGYIDETTEIGAPSCDYTINLATSDNIQEKLDEMADGKTGSYSVAVMLQAGQTYYFYKVGDSKPKDVFTIPDGMSVYFYGDKNNAPTIIIDCDQMKVDGDHDVIAFQKVKLQGEKYFMNQSAACNVGKLEFTLCEISGFTGSTFVRCKDNAEKTFGTIEVNKCLISNCGGNYDIFDLRKATVETLSIKNSTIYNCAGSKSIVQSDKVLKNFIMNGVTVYNCVKNQPTYKLGTTGEKVTITNVIFAKSADTGTQASTSAANPSVTNTYVASDWLLPITGASAIDAGATAIFADPANGDFTVNEAYASYGAGDPRWLP